MNVANLDILHLQISQNPGTLQIFLFDSVQTVFDVAFDLAFQKLLGIWDSAIANSQEAGHGQLRRQWISPPGNIYACIRLPAVGVFKTEAATPFLGLLCALALNNLGWPVLLKWPNDLILMVEDEPGKVGGMLLEDRGNVLLAGIGINLASSPSPDKMREKTALNSTFLNRSSGCGKQGIQPLKIWTGLVQQMLALYSRFTNSDDQWQKYYNEFLLWKNKNVEIEDGLIKHSGKLLGIKNDGSIQISSKDGMLSFNSGSLARAAKNHLHNP